MRRQVIVALLLCAGCLPSALMAQDKGSVTGSLESNSIYYLDDSVIGSPEHPWGSNNYFKLDYAKGGFSAGLQAEYYPQALAGYPAELKGAGLTGLYAAWNGDWLEATAGSFFEQLGSGILLRTWEDRELGLNNALMGGRITFHTPNRGVSFKVLGGMPKYGLWPTKGTAVAGADLSFDLLPLFGRESEHSIVLEGSVVDRYTSKVEDNIAFLASTGGFEVPSQVLSWSGRLQYSIGGFSLKGEYVGKGNDFYTEHLRHSKQAYRLKGGNAQLIELNYAVGSFSAAVTLRRLENMTDRIFLTASNPSPANTLNYLPSLCMQQTYMLAGLNPYVTYADGEAGFQGDLYYTFRRETVLGGKYGMKLHVGGSWIEALPCALPDRETHYLAYRDINIDLERTWSRKFKTIFFVSIQENSPTHGNAKRTDAQNVFVLDALYRFSKTVSLRTELQYLYSQELTRDWMAGLVELSFAPHWSISASDMYNHGDTKVHYYNIGAAYSWNALNISLNAGRTREGMVCSGGVCRWQPAFKGVSLRAQWSF
ncbi:MAG: hypothetical protein IKV62_00940 [Bacteroidales bacterium]|nr:hypothetical protein [Bacteroidales bacterium]